MMLVRSIVPALSIAFAGLAAAQATAPVPAAEASAATTAAAAAPADAASEATQSVAAAPKQRCHKEYRVGSDIPKTVCETTTESQEDRLAREHALDELKHAVKSGPYTPGH